MRFYRSEPMKLCSVLMDPSSAYDNIAALGNKSLVSFLDMNEEQPLHARKFSPQIRAIDNLEQKLQVLTKVLTNANMPIPMCKKQVVPPTEKDIFNSSTTGIGEMDVLRKVTSDIVEVTQDMEKMQENLAMNEDLRSVLTLVIKLMSTGGGISRNPSIQRDSEEGKGDPAAETTISVIGGVIARSRAFTFETVLMRTCRGNYIMHSVPNKQSPEMKKDPRNEFIIFCHGGGVAGKVESLGKAFRAVTFKLPNEKLKCIDLLRECEVHIKDIKKTMATSKDQFMNLLNQAARNHSCWKNQLLIAKATYLNLNLLNTDGKQVYVAQVWVPEKNFNEFKDVLEATRYPGSIQPIIKEVDDHNEDPPTFFRQNKFTEGFQNIIDAYGPPAYQEINPMPFTVITFPFLFGVMFGDIGHGVLMMMFAITTVVFEKQLIAKNIKNEIFSIMFSGRYIILLMSFFAIYAGILYNDVFGLALCLIPSKWKVNYDKVSTVQSNNYLQLNPTTDFEGTPSMIGIDCVWVNSKNKIDFMNSFKMKTSIILGISQMTFGIFLSLLNHLYFRHYLDVYTEFAPRLIFFTFLFGYLIILVFIKWCTYGPGLGDERSSACAPSVLITFINMMLFKKNEELPNCAKMIYPGQDKVQTFLLYTAMLAVPWMLLSKPIILINRLKKQKKIESEKGPVAKKTKKGHGHEDEGAMDIFVQECIHTIEFVLGCVSYTASYLRLWALSLAHSQLSEVLWRMVFCKCFDANRHYLGSGVMCVFVFFAWAALTVAILVLMEGLSAFLHTLRLHWMEFQSKFYAGTGTVFRPFSFARVLKEGLEEK